MNVKAPAKWNAARSAALRIAADLKKAHRQRVFDDANLLIGVDIDNLNPRAIGYVPVIAMAMDRQRILGRPHAVQRCAKALLLWLQCCEYDCGLPYNIQDRDYDIEKILYLTEAFSDEGSLEGFRIFLEERYK